MQHHTLYAVAVLVSALVIACEPGEPAPEPDDPAETDGPTEIVEEDPEATEADDFELEEEEVLEDGLVTYTAGSVEDRITGESWRFTDIGVEFGFDHAFRTDETGTAELQFGDSITIHIDDSTELEIEQLAGVDEADAPGDVETVELPAMTEFSVSPDPEDATVALPGRPRSRGSARTMYAAGTEVRVRVTHDDYESFEETVAIDPDGPQQLSVALTPEQPDEEAVADIDEEPADTPDEEPPEAPEPAAPDTPDEETAALQEDEEAAEPVETAVDVTLTFDVQPEETSVEVDGEPVTGMSHVVTVEEQEQIAVLASADGYETERREMEIGYSDTEQIALQLEPDPLLAELTPFESEVVQGVGTRAGSAPDTDTGSVAYLADFSGTVAAISAEGEQLWRTETSNEFNENASPW